MQMATTSGTPVVIDEAAVQELQMTLHGPLLRPGDPGYDAARVVFNGIFDRRPGLIVRCRGAADVMDAVQFARRHALLIAVRGGGHNVAGNSVCDDGLMIDLSLMHGVYVDHRAGTVRVQGGATWADVDRETQAFGLATPGGVVSSTGVAGLTLNGGIGWLRNKYGLSCDNLVSAEVVTADGALLTASASENPDLYWALRGGGGNFGIVTSFEFQLHPVGPLVAATFPMYPMACARDVLQQWREWVVTTPDEVTSEIVLWTMPAAPDLPPAVHDQAAIIAAGVYAGAPDKGAQVLQPLREFGTPLGEITGALPFRVVQKAFDPFFPKTGELLSYWKSLYTHQLSNEVIDLIVERSLHRSSRHTMIIVQHFGGAVQRVRPEATAFATRDATFVIGLLGTWHDRSESDQHIAWVRDAWNRLSPYSTGAVYLNYLGQEEQDADALIRSAFGLNYNRLVAVKTQYDPTNLFRLNQNVIPKS
jgi:FAD/FMN-containing dehydrogenase